MTYLTPTADDLDSLPASELRVPVLTWEFTINPGPLPTKRWMYVVGVVAATPECYFIDRGNRKIPATAVSPSNPLSSDFKWTLVAPHPITLIVATMEAAVCHMVDTITLYGGNVILNPVPFIPRTTVR